MASGASAPGRSPLRLLCRAVPSDRSSASYRRPSLSWIDPQTAPARFGKEGPKNAGASSAGQCSVRAARTLVSRSHQSQRGAHDETLTPNLAERAHTLVHWSSHVAGAEARTRPQLTTAEPLWRAEELREARREWSDGPRSTTARTASSHGRGSELTRVLRWALREQAHRGAAAPGAGSRSLSGRDDGTEAHRARDRSEVLRDRARDPLDRGTTLDLGAMRTLVERPAGAAVPGDGPEGRGPGATRGGRGRGPRLVA